MSIKLTTTRWRQVNVEDLIEAALTSGLAENSSISCSFYFSTLYYPIIALIIKLSFTTNSSSIELLEVYAIISILKLMLYIKGSYFIETN